MKKKISTAMALLLTLSVFSGCQVNDGSPDITVSLTEDTFIEYVTEEDGSVTETELITDSYEDEGTETLLTDYTAAETEAPVTEGSLIGAVTVTAEYFEKASGNWSETEISDVFYTTQACYSREKPVVGADTVKKYAKGTKIIVTAATNTGYFKLADGSFIHADYLTEDKPAVTSRTTSVTAANTTSKSTSVSKSGAKTSYSSVYNTDYTSRYAYKTLSSAKKRFYGDLVKAVYNLDKTCPVPDGLMTEDVIQIYGLVYNQETQLFWMSSTIPSGYNQINLSYQINDKARIQKMQNEIDEKTKTLMEKVNSYSSTVSKIKVIYDYIVLNNDFQELDSGLSSSVYNGIIGVDGLQCAGYAKTFMYLCDLAGIECMTITGTNTQGTTHAWNKVYVDNGYYNIDTTWADPLNKHDERYIRYLFFLVPDAWIKDSHLTPSMMIRRNGSQIKYFTPPVANKTSYNYFKIYKKEFSTLASAEKALYAEFDTAFKTKKNTVHIRVTDKDIYDKLLSTDYAKVFQRYAREKGKASSLARQVNNTQGALVVQYDIFY